MATIDILPPIVDTDTSAIIQFEVTDDGAADSDGPWIVNIGYKTHTSSEWIWLEDISGSGEGSYQQNVTELSSSEQYDAIAMITNPAGVCYSDVITFWTVLESQLPEVSTMPAQNITCSSGQLESILVDNGYPNDTSQAYTRFTYWKTGGRQETTDWLGAAKGQKSSITVNGLDPNTEYYFYAQASNSTGQVDGSTLSFKTFPDPNMAPIAFEPNEPNTLLIQNFVKLFFTDPNKPHNNQGLVMYVEKSGNINGIDSNDIFYTNPDCNSSKIISIIEITNPKGEVTGFHELSVDARPVNAQDSLLEVSIYSPGPNDPNISSENSLKFWLAKNAFKGKTVSIQKVSSDPNIVYPVWDVNEIISRNGRKMPLNNLADQKLNAPYAWFSLSTNRQILDLNRDGIVDLTDYDLLTADVGKTGIFRSDIASMKGTAFVPGIPDGKVNDIDLIAFVTEYNKNHPENPIPIPYAELSEDFESGQIQEPLTASGTNPWTIIDDSHEGIYSAKSGNIYNNQNSVLEANIIAPTGNISFWRKVSSESGFDKLIFYIDGIEQESWSGELEWEEITYQIVPGTHILKWEYKKDWSNSVGEDAAWIDDVNIF